MYLIEHGDMTCLNKIFERIVDKPRYCKTNAVYYILHM
jgi:hypothetical protein